MFSVESTRATDLAAILKKLILLRQDVDYLTHYPVPACLPGDFQHLLLSFGQLLPQKIVETKWSLCYFEISPWARTRGTTTSLHGSTVVVLGSEWVQLEGTHGFGSFKANLATICLWWVFDCREPCDDSDSGRVRKFPNWLGSGFFPEKNVPKWKDPPITNTIGPAQDDALTQSREEIPSGGLWFLKGAGRIHTVMALMVYISKHTTSTLEVRVVITIICLHLIPLSNCWFFILVTYDCWLGFVPWRFSMSCCTRLCPTSTASTFAYGTSRLNCAQTLSQVCLPPVFIYGQSKLVYYHQLIWF